MTYAAVAPSRSALAGSPWLLAAVVVVPTFMEVLDTTIAIVALRYIAGGLSATVDDGEWVLTSYLAANAIILPITGWLSAHLGRRNYFLLSIAIFTLGSALCGLATSLGQLIVFRIIQGLAGGGLQPSSQAVLLDAFPREKQGTAMTLFGLAALLAPVIGPTLGGWLTDQYQWRWVFLINVPIGLFAFAGCYVLLRDPEYLTKERTELKKRPFHFGQARVVGCAGNSLALQLRRQALHVLARLGVDDAALAGMAAHDLQHLRRLVAAREGAIDQVRAVGMADEARGPPQGELGADILLDRGRGRRGQGHARRLGKALQDLGQAAVLGPEFVAPMRDAVRLVHRYQDQPPGDVLEQVSYQQALRAYVEEVGLARGQPPVRLAARAGLQVRVEGVGGQARLSRRGDLVVHEGDERGDDEDEPAAQRGGKLVAEALSSSGRQDDQAVLAGQSRRDRLFLKGLERLVSPAPLSSSSGDAVGMAQCRYYRRYPPHPPCG